ncbi:MAG: hypothetical protein ACRDBY_04825 [Cetobacterium sp.]
MASPSNKTTGKTYLEKNFNKEQLIDRILMQEAQLFDSEEKYNKLFADFNSAKKQNVTLQRKLDRLNTEEDIIKKILEYRARNYSPTMIVEKLRLESIEKIDVTKVKDIINGELNPELELYYNKCKQEFTESIKINTTYYKQSSIDEFQRLIDSAYEDLENSDKEDIKLRDSLRNSISNLIAKRDNLMRNIDEASVADEEDEIADEATQEWIKDSEDSIINLSKIMELKLG